MNNNMSSSSCVHYAEVGGIMVRNIAILTPKSTQDDFIYAPIPVFPGKDIFVGRDEEICCPCIKNSIVSRVHFRLYSVVFDVDQMTEYPAVIYCEDRQSSNGTYINKTLIGTHNSPKTPYLLNDGDVISIRPYWTFLFRQTGQANLETLDYLQTQESELFKRRYTISSRILGSGVYGKVFLANDELNEMQVACKIVDLRKKPTTGSNMRDTPSDDVGVAEVHALVERKKDVDEMRKKLLREIEILNKVSHPNIVTLFKAFCTPHSLYIFIELAAGGDLYSFLQQNGPCLEDLHARVISRQVAVAVEYLHESGIAHRDLKPENILVMRTGIGHRVVLTDFGCAGYVTTETGRMMSIVGTYDYVAPEVLKLETKGYTQAIDMWSLGIITLYLLTGDPSASKLDEMSQIKIVLQLDKADQDYPKIRKLSRQGKDFIKNLVILEPQRRMTAREAVNHDWFRKPSKIAAEMDKLYERSIAFWRTRSNDKSIVENLPDVLLEVSKLSQVCSGKAGTCYRRTVPHKIPDAASPYFSLERHLHLRGVHNSSNSPLRRRSILEKLMQTGSQFIEAVEQPEKSLEVNASSLNRLHMGGVPSNLSNSAPLVPHAANPNLEDKSQLGYPISTLRRESAVMDSGPSVQIDVEHIQGRIEREQGKKHTGIAANGSRRREPISAVGLSVREVDACDLFDTVPVEIKDVENSEADKAAYDNCKSSHEVVDEERKTQSSN